MDRLGIVNQRTTKKQQERIAEMYEIKSPKAIAPMVRMSKTGL